MEYSYIILLLPMLMFITLGLCGHKMSHRTAGLLGTSGLFIITILSYIVAAQYFMQPRVDGIYPTVTPYHFEWLRFTEWLHFDLGLIDRTPFGHDAGGYHHSLVDGASLQPRLYAR